MSISDLAIRVIGVVIVLALVIAGCGAITKGVNGLTAGYVAPTPTPNVVIDLARAVENQSEAITNLSELAHEQGRTISTLTVDAVAQREAKIAEQEQALKEKDQMMVVIAVGCCLVAVLFVSLTRRKA